MPTQDTFDSSEYAWKDIEIVVLGRTLIRVLDVKYKASQKLEGIYGRGQNPVGIQEGNYAYKGELKIGQSELEAMTLKAKQLGFRSILKLKFDVNISYSLDGVLVRDVCKSGRIEEYEKGMKQGDTNMEIALPFMFTLIDNQI
ncbi:MAG TPA: hypothetical protein PK431_01680 [Chitinophagales bacterium]|nr:hypothetical protein [Chitinophagales bacterium]